jgi:hypothetical protein
MVGPRHQNGMMFLTVLRCLAFVMGLVAYYVAFFMYEDAEGKLQNRIEQLWIAVNDRKRITGSTASALFNKIASVVTRTFDRVFGHKLLSLQLIGVSVCYALAGLFLFISLFFLWIQIQLGKTTTTLPPEVTQSLPLVIKVTAIIGLTMLVLGILPALKRSFITVFLSLVPVAFLVSGIIKVALRHEVSEQYVVLMLGLFFSFLSDVAFVVLVRVTIRRLTKENHTLAFLLALFAQIAVIALLVVFPFVIVSPLLEKFGQGIIVNSLVALTFFNMFTCIAASLFLLTLLFVLLHRAVWPILDKVVYPIAARRVVRDHKLMAGIGTGCMVFTFPLMWSIFKSILEWLAK